MGLGGAGVASRDVRPDPTPLPVRLVLPRAEHAAAWARWRAQPTAVRFLPIASTPVEGLAERLVRGAAPWADTSAAEHRRMLVAGDDLVGTVALTHVSRSMGYGEVGYHVDERWHGQGIGTRGVRAFVASVLRETPLRRLTALVHVGNVPSARLLERLGFRREGVLRAHYLIGGEPADHAFYGLLREEWRPAP